MVVVFGATRVVVTVVVFLAAALTVRALPGVATALMAITATVAATIWDFFIAVIIMLCFLKNTHGIDEIIMRILLIER